MCEVRLKSNEYWKKKDSRYYFMKNIIYRIFWNDSLGKLCMEGVIIPWWFSFERLLRWLLIFGKKKSIVFKSEKYIETI